MILERQAFSPALPRSPASKIQFGALPPSRESLHKESDVE
jgi:hypothetical protein